MAKKFYWLKLKDIFFNQKEIKKLRRVAGGDTFTIIYLKMQLLSIKTGGIIEYDGTESTIEEQLSLEIDEDIDNIKITMAFMAANNLIEKISDTEYLLNKVPELIGSESDAAERMRKMREKRNTVTLECNEVTPLLQDVTQRKEKEKEIEKEIDLDNKSKKKTTKKTTTKKDVAKPKDELLTMMSEYASGILLETLIEFGEMRKELKKPLTTRALKLIIKELDTHGSDDIVKVKMLEQSIMNGYQGVFPIKEQKQVYAGYSKPKNTQADMEKFMNTDMSYLDNGGSWI